MQLTRREKHALFIAAVIVITLAIGSSLAPSKQLFNQRLQDYELAYLFFIVAPLGFYLASDPERRENKE